MAQRVRKPYRGRKRPSSATQLPILAALHAGLPTLFAINIHDLHAIVKTQMENFSNHSMGFRSHHDELLFSVPVRRAVF